jgi:ADP-ribosyl-[dinitrogen reductase] hydrolase
VQAYGVHRDMVGGGWLKLPVGQVTDDTTMSLALGEALLAGGDTALQSFVSTGDETLVRGIGDAYVRWLKGKPVDCGNTCRRGIQRYLRDGSLAGPLSEGDGGNGALMRNLPAVLATLGDDDRFEAVSIAQAHVTHHHRLSDAAVLGLGHLLRAQLAGADAATMLQLIDAWVATQRAFRFRPYPSRASGYVVDTVQTVLHAFTEHADFEAAVVCAVNRGEDADTTGALVGMLAGARCGAQALPGHWLGRLDRDIVRAITAQTAALLALAPAPAPCATPSTPLPH